MYYHLKSGPVFQWFNHLNTGHKKVQYSDESGIQVFGIQMVTVFHYYLSMKYLRNW